MSQLLINDYLKQLSIIKKISGSQRETIVREAFKDLLKRWGRQQNLVFLAEYPLKTALKTNINVDGALLHELRMPLGFWEAKDADDDLDFEMSKKFKKGYPQDNIIFSDDAVAVLWQRRQEVLRCDMTDTTALAQLLKLFFSYERPEIAGFRVAVEQFKSDLPAVLQSLREMIDTQEKSNKVFCEASRKFLIHAQEVINPDLNDEDVREMLIQHILTEEIFAEVFDDADFHQKNNVARELYALEGVFFTGSLKKQTLKGLESYYAAIRATAAQISSHGEKQTFLKVIYENFYKVYNPKAADRLGVVYTPNELVRFMVDGADWLCDKYFSKRLIDEGVDILDPATGTGTYICELMEHFRGQPKKLEHKYKYELHANEVAILPYYVANLNIEATYAAITDKYDEFPSLCFMDTLDNVGLHTAAKFTTGDIFGSVSDENVARIKRQNGRRISVIIGNPPYNANQVNENDNNKNRTYPAIDARIKKTYIAESTAQKTKLYDMYARFFRWASDRLDENGVLAFVTNRSFIDSRTFDGFRKSVAHEFTDIYVVDLGGDVRANPKLSGTKHNVFGIQTGVAISFMVKRTVGTNDKPLARVRYVRRPEMETAEEKLGFLANNLMQDLEFDEVQPDKRGTWISQTYNDFDSLLPLASKDSKKKSSPSQARSIFWSFASGIKTNRDEWVYDFDAKNLAAKVSFFSDKLDAHLSGDFDTSIKWSRDLKLKVARVGGANSRDGHIVTSLFRPFVRQSYWVNKTLSDILTEFHFCFYGRDLLTVNPTIAFLGVHSSNPLTTLATNGPFDYCLLKRGNGGTESVPRWVFLADGSSIDNITDWALKKFKAHYAEEVGKGKTARKITKDAIFYYCYAVLHDPVYLEKYANNLKRDLPRIPFYAEFWRWAAWGEELVELHINFEKVVPFPVLRIDVSDEGARSAGLLPKVILRGDPVNGSIALDSETTLKNIPAEAWAYKIGNRSVIDWVLDQYKEKKPRDSTIRANFDTYSFNDYKDEVVERLREVVTVGIETDRILKEIQTGPR